MTFIRQGSIHGIPREFEKHEGSVSECGEASALPRCHVVDSLQVLTSVSSPFPL
jgi:hypothetical protein